MNRVVSLFTNREEATSESSISLSNKAPKYLPFSIEGIIVIIYSINIKT